MSIKQEKITNQPENQVNTRRNKDNKNRPMKTSVIYLDYQTQIIINYVYFILFKGNTFEGPGPLESALAYFKKNQIELEEMKNTINKIKDSDGLG